MITNFEEITADLTKEEKRIVGFLIEGFKNYREENPIKAPDIVRKLNSFLSANNEKIKLDQPKLRKYVNYIRVNSLLPLMATSKGYFVSHDKAVIESQVKSLRERASSINNCAEGLQRYINH